MDRQIEAFVAGWMRDNVHVLEEITHLQADDPSTPYGAAMATYLESAKAWPPTAGGPQTRSRPRPPLAK